MAEISRRALLGRSAVLLGLAAGAGAGFARHVHHRVALPPPPPPAALVQALAAQQSVRAGYEHASGLPAGLIADAQAHRQALRALLELYPGWRLAQAEPAPAAGAPTAGPPVPANRQQLVSAVSALTDQLRHQAEAWPATDPHAVEVAPVLASIAASLQTHRMVLG